MPSTQGRGFSERVAIVFVTQVLMAVIGIFNAFLFARLLGPAIKGDYYLLVMLPATGMVLLQFGLPQALAFYAARRQVIGMIGKMMVLAIVLTMIGILVVVPLMPLLRQALLDNLDPVLVAAALCVLPVLLLRTLASSVVIALKAVRWFAAVMLAETLTNTVLLVLLVGVLGLGLAGALVMYASAAVIGMVGLLVGARRAIARSGHEASVSYRALLRFGLPLYPSSITSFFSSRADVFLIAALATSSDTALGYYSIAVTLAEMATYLPGAVSSVFLPHVAGTAREDADRHVTMVARSTVMLTAVTAVVIAPAGTILISVLLPAFTASLPALYVLLPAVISLALARVVGQYVSGLGHTGRTSAATVLGFAVNLVANVILIPQLGIVGAALASLISYTTTAVAISVIASSLAHAPLSAFWVPRAADVRFLSATGVALLRRLRGRGAGNEPGTDSR
jgi:O-antigen/teichoic acid export membrane protein